MGSYMKMSWTSEECRDNLHRFNAITYNDLLAQEKQLPNRYKLNVTFLFATKAQKKYKAFMPPKGKLLAKTNEITVFDRFIVLGVDNTSNICLVFLKSPMDSKSVLRFSAEIYPGKQVTVLMPRVEGFLKGTQNPLIKLNDPLVPTDADTLPLTLVKPPATVELEEYKYFQFRTRTLRVTAATPITNICTGVFCDSQTGISCCACLLADPQRHWCLTFHLMCDEMMEVTRGEVQMISLRTTKLLLAPNIVDSRLSDIEIDPFDMDDAVRNLIDNINSNQGFLIKGWFKPAITEEGVTTESFTFHISHLRPWTTLTDNQMLLRYNGVVTGDPSDLPEGQSGKYMRSHFATHSIRSFEQDDFFASTGPSPRKTLKVHSGYQTD